jgi:hypothetical protein
MSTRDHDIVSRRRHVAGGSVVSHCMKQRTTTADAVLFGTVIVHLAISVAHGIAHDRAAVNLPPAAMFFVLTVILIGPIAGALVYRFARRREGAWLVAATMAAALVFGVANHFLIDGSDHVMHVAEPWRVWFGATAALLAITEVIGTAAALWCAAAASGKMGVRLHTRVGQ